jgi:peptidoglycan/xylan/chitin deacetylase (PgdA/CDA1 family)
VTVVPVLVYHAITETPGTRIAPFTVTPSAFERHLDLVVAAGRRSATFSELTDGGPVAPSVVITFDDGYADFRGALPALQARSLVATLYVTTGWLDGGPNEPGPSDAMLSWSELPELDAAGVEVGAHSHSHPQLDTLAPGVLRDELRRPKDLLEDALGHAVPSFAYPHGYHGPRVRRSTREAGYRSAAAVRNALHSPGEDRFAVSRLMLTSTTTDAQLAAWLDGDTAVAPRRESMGTIGWRVYRRGRALLRGIPGSDYR